MAFSDYAPINYPDFNSHDDFINWTGKNKWNAVYTITLGELIDKSVFSWDLDILNWKEAAYSAEQYNRLCNYFIDRFLFREISIEPFYEWAIMLKRKIVYELMPKYRNLYEHLSNFDPAQTNDKYHKRRSIGSDYPETLLSGNSDYISNGQDEESEDVERGNLTDSYNNYVNLYRTIDELLLDDLESMFIGIYTTSISGM